LNLATREGRSFVVEVQVVKRDHLEDVIKVAVLQMEMLGEI
jgi:hypothetical protein